MGSWWAGLPRGSVVHLDGVDADTLAASLDPLPADAPVVLTYRPRVLTTQALIVDEVLGLLETSAVGLFPAWLPDAAGITGAGGANVPAVRALASRLAGRTHHFGPFLADLAVRALTGSTSGATFLPEVRAAGLSRVLEAAYDRADVVLLIDVPADLSRRNEQALVAAAEWLAHHGQLGGVWLTGERLTAVDWIQSRSIGRRPVVDRHERPPLSLPPLAGRPHPNSDVEKLLEKALASYPWAAERRWNKTIELGPLVKSERVDLLWEAERTVVEVDGDDHWRRQKYADDRIRDVHLQIAGYAVLRFTNDQVRGDVHGIAQQIHQFLITRRVS